MLLKVSQMSHDIILFQTTYVKSLNAGPKELA